MRSLDWQAEPSRVIMSCMSESGDKPRPYDLIDAAEKMSEERRAVSNLKKAVAELPPPNLEKIIRETRQAQEQARSASADESRTGIGDRLRGLLGKLRRRTEDPLAREAAGGLVQSGLLTPSEGAKFVKGSKSATPKQGPTK